MRRGPSPHARSATALAITVGLLASTAATTTAAARTLGTTDVPETAVAVAETTTPRVLQAVDTGLRPALAAAARRAASTARHTSLLVRVPRTSTAFARPRRGARKIGSVPAGSKYYGLPTVAWVERVSANGRWGRVELPYVWPRREGWIRLDGLRRTTTTVRVEVDLSEHRVVVRRRGRVLVRAPGATGAPASPTPPGDYFVTDRVAFPGGGPLGSFAFGISGIQPRLPAGWSGGDQLAIHGTNQPSSIGRSVSAGCVRVSEATLDRLRSLLGYGTPVVIHR
jgi:lipoprotein-anchoring transpeptidase ErfK/SrfK